MVSAIVRILRGAASLALFACFGAGALALTPLVLLLRTPERAQPLVRASWIVLVGAFVGLRLLRIDRGNLPNCRGTVLVANHPTLIDVVLLSVLVPRTLSIAKRAVWRNPIMGVVARAMSVPVGADAFESAVSYLQKGWNILVFPEGTRSPSAGTDPLYRFRRGAAQLALRTGAPLVCVGIGLSRRILAKRQPVWDMGTDPVCCRFRADAPTVAAPREGESRHAAACRVTQELQMRVGRLLT